MEKFKNYLLQCKERLLLELQGKELVYNIIDVLAVALLVYIIFAFLKKYNCTRLIKYLVVGTFVSLILSAGFFPLPMLAYLAKFVMLAMLLGFVVLFHSEIKRTLWKLSSPKEAEENYTTIYDVSDQELRHTISEIVRATINMAKKDVGALMLIAPNDVPDSVVERVHNHVLQGMGLVVLHSGHFSKIFRKVCGTPCNLTWHDDSKERLFVVNPGHPIAQGLPPYFEIPNEECYGEPFGIPEPDELVFLGWYNTGEVFRSGCCFHRCNGRIFYFQPGHETDSSFFIPEVQQIYKNAARWCAPVKRVPELTCPFQPPLEKVD